ncbi:hypothetical protein QJ854_gp151 [Moumouvirus goulette]|uniref:Potassium channel tetramerisation-type BTB domain-containing protein n=1 Tax=Moumouvirus goulette TaxID=1247379 RepID=M1PNN0_9VIRU|nr:hypothetical protein QJ854_gp151 [Moumouvirus goulette]AGF85631.1 hypothetical protein glt_00826 [Moumouvirus goulette]
MEDNTIIKIKTTGGILQTYFQTIKLCQPLIDKIENNIITVDIEYRIMSTFINYLRGVFKIEKLYKIAYELKNIGIEFEMEGYVYINIGGKIFCLDKIQLENKFSYFEIFFRRYESLHPDYTSILIDRCPILFKLILNYHIYKIIKTRPLYIDEDEKHFCINTFSSKNVDFKNITHIESNMFSGKIYELINKQIDHGNVFTFEEYETKYNPLIFFYVEKIQVLDYLNKIEIINNGVTLNTKLHIHNKNILYNDKTNILLINGGEIIHEIVAKLPIRGRFQTNTGTFKIIIPEEIIIKEHKITNKINTGTIQNILTKKVNKSCIIILPNDISHMNFILTSIAVVPEKKIGRKITAEVFFNDELICKSLLYGVDKYYISELKTFYNHRICLPSENNFKIIFKFPEELEDNEIMFLCDYSLIDKEN